MSDARPVYKKSKLMLTRRIRGRQFLLRPSPKVNRLVGYVLAMMQKKWKIKIVAVVVMSNHWHVVLYDEHGNIVEFQRDCHSFIARGLNAGHGEFEAVWSSSSPSRVLCEQPDDLVNKVAYAMANPVEACLVKHGHSWPGIRKAWPAAPQEFERPHKFFRGEEKGGEWPEVATLKMSRPPGYRELDDEELAAVVNAAIKRREEKLRKKNARGGKSYLGRKRILAQSRHARPTSREKRFGISPKIACRDKWRRIERIEQNKRWLHDYRVAMQGRIRGDDVEFPHGTYLMRVRFGVKCAGPPR